MIGLDGLVPLLAPGARVWQAPGAAGRAGALARSAGWARVLLVTDPGVARLALFDQVLAGLQGAGLEVSVFAGVQADPPIASVQAALAASTPPPDAVISLGGGSSIDTAKAIAACLAEGRDAASLADTPPNRALPHLAIPTTAGTGAEASNSAILTDDAGRKRAIIADCLPPGLVLLDPGVLAGQPRGLLVACGLDALSHGLESLVSRQGTAGSRLYSRECIRLVAQALPRLLDHPADADAMAQLQWGAHLGGMALRLARLGYAHAIAHAVAEHRHAPHGLLVAQALPAVIAFNTEAAAALYNDAATAALYNDAATAAGHPDMFTLVAALMAAGGVAPGQAHHALTGAEAAAIVARCVAGPFHQWNPRRAEAQDFARMLAA